MSACWQMGLRLLAVPKRELAVGKAYVLATPHKPSARATAAAAASMKAAALTALHPIPKPLA